MLNTTYNVGIHTFKYIKELKTLNRQNNVIILIGCLKICLFIM